MSIIQNIEKFTAQTPIPCLGPLGQKYQFLKGESMWFSQKLNIIKLSLFLFLVPSCKLFYGNVQKTRSPSQYENTVWMSWKLCMQQKIWKFSIFIAFSNTMFILKYVHFIWSQLQHRMKSSNYVLDLKTIKNFKFNTPQIWTFLLNNVQRFSTMHYHGQRHYHCYFLLWSLWL